ncbi:hypothetical protein EV127DRAFT_51634 [Xylaria flabelliformis]|nr:hypothetical protein EV127DRAFT_51634 [Xylaria flabelliformis]
MGERTIGWVPKSRLHSVRISHWRRMFLPDLSRSLEPIHQPPGYPPHSLPATASFSSCAVFLVAGQASMLSSRLGLDQLQAWRRSSRSSRKALTPYQRPFACQGAAELSWPVTTALHRRTRAIVVIFGCVSAPCHIAAVKDVKCRFCQDVVRFLTHPCTHVKSGEMG